MKHIISIILSFAAVSVVMSFVACQTDLDELALREADSPIEFGFTVRETEEIRTRADETENKGNGLDSTYITSTPFDMTFYIQLCSPDNQQNEHTKLGLYQVPSSYAGRLDPIDKENALKWNDLTSQHTFYAWNAPWNEDKTYAEFYQEQQWTPTLTEEGEIEKITITFFDSPESENKFDQYKNNAVYENFIGAKSVPHNYKQHGKYVDLTFHHLVSKIKIASLVLIESSGAIKEDIMADITFVGMPTTATFHPHPEDGGRPRLDPIWPDTKDTGLTYYVKNDNTTEDIMYICPEIDFSKIDYKIKIHNKEYADKDIYYGTFDDVVFKRKPGWAYDQGTDEEQSIDDSKTLHAGEEMTLNIVLIPGIGPGLSIIIDSWSVDKPTESQYHNTPGIYSDSEVDEILNVFANQKTYPADDATREEIRRLHELYGGEMADLDGDGEEEMVFKLYDNVSTSSNIFPIPDGCILDGMGHTITMKTNWGSNNDFGHSSTYFNIGPVRNVYLRDTNGNTIYIDSDGYVWIFNNETRDYEPTSHKLEPLVEPYKSYDISCENGTVHKSTYYNNKVVGS